MEFFNSTDKEKSLYHDTLFLLGIKSTDTTAFAVDGDFTRSANVWTRRVVTWIWNSSSTWEFDDSNHTDLPIATTALVDAQQDYALPATAFRLEKVEVLDSGGDYNPVKQIDKSELKHIALSEYQETDGMPVQYDLIGNSLFLYPAPATADVTLAAGLKLYFSRDINEFTPADTTQEPGFPGMFHRLVSIGAALDFAVRNEMTEKIAVLKTGPGMFQELKIDLETHYGSRNRDMTTRIKPKNYQRQMR
jgi:hypothetical protein